MPGDLSGDYELKKNFYDKIPKSEKNAITLTYCYFNKLKYRSMYQDNIEKKIKKITK